MRTFALVHRNVCLNVICDDEFENVDVVAENVAYDIQQNANSVDFDEAPDPNEGHVVDYEPEKEAAETIQTEEEQPAWMQ